MPTYEYECQKCKDHFDVFQKMTDEPRAACPKCGGAGTRLIGAGSGIIFKGSGFYQTDYKNKAKPHDHKIPPCSKSDGCKGCPGNKGE
jgi:putative FmdB family regulatory protein